MFVLWMIGVLGTGPLLFFSRGRGGRNKWRWALVVVTEVAAVYVGVVPGFGVWRDVLLSATFCKVSVSACVLFSCFFFTAFLLYCRLNLGAVFGV